MATHNTVHNSQGFHALFGNMVETMQYDNTEPFLTWYKRMLYMSVQNCFGDMDLFKDGRIIRSVWNAKERISHKDSLYTLKYKKY